MNQKFSKHIHLAHKLWDEVLKAGDAVIDATCGNGHDTCFLAKKILTEQEGFLYGYDIQKKAIENTYQKLEQEKIPMNRVHLIQKSHIDFSDIKTSVKLIVYNLGYLPGFDKQITTLESTTLESIEKALLLNPSYISIMCYPGHNEGKTESFAVVDYLSKLDAQSYSIFKYQNINRKDSPFLLFLENLLV